MFPYKVTVGKLLFRSSGQADLNMEPYFVSRGRSYRVKLGTRVTFHCEVSRRGHNSLQPLPSDNVTAKLVAWTLVTT